MRSPILVVLVYLSLCPAVVSAGQCAAGEGALGVHSRETVQWKLRYPDKRGIDSADLQISLDATSEESAKQLDSLYSLGKATLSVELHAASFDSFSTPAVRVEGEQGRTKCIFFEEKKAAHLLKNGIAFLEGQDGGGPKVCITEDGRVVSTLSMGFSRSAMLELGDSLEGLKVSLFVPKRGAESGTTLFSATESGCRG